MTTTDKVLAFTVTGNDFSTGDGVSPTIRAGSDRQNTTPMVVQIASDVASSLEARSHKGPNAESAAGGHLVVVVPIQDGRGMEKAQNGFGVGEPGDPMYTLDTTGAQSIAYEIVIPCQVDGSPVSSTLRGFGHGWQGQHNSTNAVVQSLHGDIAGTLDANYGKGPGERGGTERDVVVQSIGTGPVAYSIREDATNNTFNATPTDTALCINALQPSPQSHHAQIFVVQEEHR